MTEWQVPRELPDLRRVDIISLDTETLDRGVASRPRLVLAMARRLCLRHQRRLARGRRDSRASTFRCAIPTATISIPRRSIGWLKDLIASGVRIVTQNGIYDCGWLRAEGGIVMPPSDRLEEVGALATIDRREPVQATASTRSASATACPARTRRC